MNTVQLKRKWDFFFLYLNDGHTPVRTLITGRKIPKKALNFFFLFFFHLLFSFAWSICSSLIYSAPKKFGQKLYSWTEASNKASAANDIMHIIYNLYKTVFCIVYVRWTNVLCANFCVHVRSFKRCQLVGWLLLQFSFSIYIFDMHLTRQMFFYFYFFSHSFTSVRQSYGLLRTKCKTW